MDTMGDKDPGGIAGSSLNPTTPQDGARYFQLFSCTTAVHMVYWSYIFGIPICGGIIHVKIRAALSVDQE